MTIRWTRLLNWRSALVYTHRWLGIAGCVLFVAWFFSGVVMMYARMPSLAGEEVLARAPALDLSTVSMTPAEAAAAAGVRPTGVTVFMLQGRPAYRFGGERSGGAGGPIVFADTGERFAGMDVAGARAAAQLFEPQYAGTLHLDAYLTEPDQWTLQARGALPMYRFALDDDAATRLYVSEASGEVVLRTTRRERLWGYLGPVAHWLYFTPLRRHGSVWTEVVIWSSLIGCLMCASGLLWGLLRFSPSAHFRIRRVHAHSPYAGMLKWHHYTGLLFGVVTLTWVYSGLLSMGPFNWFEPAGGRGRQVRAGSDGPDLSTVSVENLRLAHAAFTTAFAPKSLELTRIQGAFYWIAERPPELRDADRWRSPSLMPRTLRPRLERRYVSMSAPDHGSFTRFPPASMIEVARQTLPNVPIEESVWLNSFDSYYYSASGDRALPVLRVRFGDPQQTWLYLDPASGGVVLRNEEVTRLRRWLYQGLHSLDFPFLYYSRPLWDIVVIVLSLGGLVLSATTVTPAGRRLLRHVRVRVVAIGRPRTAPTSSSRQPAVVS